MEDGQRRLKLNNEQEIDVCSYTRIHMQLYTHTHTLILAYIDTASNVLDYVCRPSSASKWCNNPIYAGRDVT